jgi:hypothetical protein
MSVLNLTMAIMAPLVTGPMAIIGVIVLLDPAFQMPDAVRYVKPPFGGPEAVLAYLSRYTHRVAISNSHLIGCNGHHCLG